MKIIENLKKSKFSHDVATFIRHRQIDYYNTKILPCIVEKKKGKETLTVAFIVYNISMWKYKSLYEAMEKDSRFKPFIVLTPSPGKSMKIREKHLEEMKEEFSRLNYYIYPKVVWKELKFDADFEADIIFLAQMYRPTFLTKELKKFLFCYCPYGFPSTSSSKWAVDTFLHNIAWKEFQATQLSIDNSSKVMYNKACNRVLTGYVFGDELSQNMTSTNNIWKDTGKKLKKIIWAPHFSIDSNHNFRISTFLEIYNLMFEFANQYNDKIQIAFKPHPFLYSTLCDDKFWGKEKTDMYYDKWRNLSNGQLEEGAYAELFSSSDAIIHDCGSFTIEYLYTRKPAMYLTDKLSEREADSLGQEALDCYYHGTTKNEIEHFIKNVVIDGFDDKFNKRNAFFDKYLQQKNNTTVADNIINIIKREL